MDYAAFAAFGLLALGLALIVAEVCIPSGGFILIFSVCCLVGSGWFAFKAWFETSEVMWWSYVAGVIILIPVSISLGLYILPKTPIGRRILLEAPSLEEVTPYAREQAQLASLVGKTGKSLTLLNPGGLVLVEGQRHHAETRSMLVDPGEPVKVIAVRGNRLVVAPQTAAPEEDTRTAEVSPSETEEPSPLDFDLPQG